MGKIGYARVSTQEQNLDLQIDALKKAGCTEIFKDKISGSKSERPGLTELINQLRAGDVIVIWKLDRLGRSLKHLIELVELLNEKKVGLLSLNDPVDTTTAQGKLIFNIFAALAEFERSIISERTKAGLTSARARGKVGGRPKGLSANAEQKAIITETLYKEGKLTIKEIKETLAIKSSNTLYRYLRHRGVKIGK